MVSQITKSEFTAEERQQSRQTIRKVAPYMWPKGIGWVKRRVVLAMALLVFAKVISVLTPFFYKAAVDNLAAEGISSPAWMLGAGAIGLTFAYGMAKLMTVGFAQLRDAAFARVGQRALRALALETFQHMHQLSMRYHITRKTGGLSRIIERGLRASNSCAFMCSAGP